MRIAQLAPPYETVPPLGYGGTERVVSVLTEALVRRGHEVTLFASGDSRTSARLVPIVDRALWHREPPYPDILPLNAIGLGMVAERLAEFDLVHAHVDYWALPLARLASRPVMLTLHGRLDLPELQPLYRTFPDVPLVSISNAQRKPLPFANWVDTVYHGIDLSEFTLNSRPSDYLAFLGRISPEKGLDTAIRVAQRVGLPIKIAARKPIDFGMEGEAERDRRYYHEVIEPLLSQPGVEFSENVDGPAKSALLENARALLFPIRWPEPFGLVMAEALACGTPVLALRDGSVPEVVESGVTGFVCDSEDELVAAVGRLGEIDRARCRAEAERRFSPEAMAERYERVYRRLLAASAEHPPATRRAA